MDKMTRSAGFAMGIEFREASMLIGPKTTLKARKGMLFNVNIGFSDLSNKDAKDSHAKKYALFVGDTVLVAPVSGIERILIVIIMRMRMIREGKIRFICLPCGNFCESHISSMVHLYYSRRPQYSANCTYLEQPSTYRHTHNSLIHSKATDNDNDNDSNSNNHHKNNSEVLYGACINRLDVMCVG